MTTTGRRALLTAGVSAAAAAALTGCTASEDPGPRKPSAAEVEAERVARAEAALRLRSVTASRTLLERYDAALAAHPALAPRLTPLRRSVAAHAKALGEGGTTVRPATAAPSPSATATATATASASASVRPTAPPVPVAADPRTALKELAAAERTAADAHTAALVTAPPEYARLLASVAAAGAAHAYLLTEGARA
ncbi:hypothetical protein ACFQ9H_38455 [Streptomyces sp. NPDC056517]|uniref:hypothetical protein n=1 Tax=Streptomyces sp. NPDC056517 TaxID=3345848 RepID=UPI0036D1302C